MRSADLSLRVPESMQFPVTEGFEEAIRREEVLSWEVDDASGTLLFVSVLVGDLEHVTAAAASLESVTRFEATPVDEDTFYGYVEVDLDEIDRSILDVFDVPGVVVVPPIVYTGGDVFHLTVLGEERALSDLFAYVPSQFDVEVERVSDHRHRPESLAGRLTARQLEALETAREVGYYEVPRTGTLADVAEALECSESTASTLLRTAVSTLVDAAIGRT